MWYLVMILLNLKYYVFFQATVASKFLTLTESVRDAADLYLSLKHTPIVFINDTPCGFVRHLECRNPKVAEKLWGKNAGCFEKPAIGKEPKKVGKIFLQKHVFAAVHFIHGMHACSVSMQRGDLN
jgi:hypothetical protein